MRRKLFCAVLSMAASIVIVYFCGIAGGLLTAASCAVCMIFFIRKHQSAKSFCLLLLFSFLAGCLTMSLTVWRAENGVLASCTGSQNELCGLVTGVEKKNEEEFRICCSIQGERLLCTWYGQLTDYPGLLGRKITFRAQVQVPEAPGNPRTFDYGLYLRTRGIFYTASIGSFCVEADRPAVRYRAASFILSAREKMIEQFQVSAEIRGFLRGVLFGDTGGLPEDIYTAFRQNGTAHVLAVSGLHVGILYGLFQMLWKRFPSAVLRILFLLFLMIYGTACCWSMSVSRAVLLILIAQTGQILHRPYDLLTALAGAALLLIVQNPFVIFGASFQMSFLAVMSMAFLTPVFERFTGKGPAAMLAVQIGLMPYMAYVFNYVSLTGLLCNIPVVFLISLLVPAGMAGFVCFLTTGHMLPLLSGLLGGLARLAVAVNGFFQADGFLSFDVVSPPLWIIAAVYAGGFFAVSEYFRIYAGRKDWRHLIPALALILALCTAAAFAGSSPFDRAEMIFVDVGQGDCVHLKTGTGQNLLIDGGGSVRFNTGEKVLKPYLLKNGVGSIDMAAATHLHTDHFLGLEELDACFEVDRLVTEGRAGQKYRFSDDEWIEILWPEEQDPAAEDENLNSLIFKVHWRGLTMLVTGDITAEGESMLLEKYSGTDVLNCDILKVAHHGSVYSTTDAFLEAVSPKAAVICVGQNNYGHPSEKVIEKMQKKDIIVFRTDLDGAVGFHIEKGEIIICTENPRNTASGFLRTT
ncbi:MAG: DNA internalization-related competence protein ComEC/Rec2 [Emergencia sp.]